MPVSTTMSAIPFEDPLPESPSTEDTCSSGLHHDPRNQGNIIHQKLPAEVLLQIFRLVTPSHEDYMAPIRLTHVCRAWRTLIHHSPTFWMDILDPDPKTLFTSHPRTFPLVLTAFKKSQPGTEIAFSLRASFLPVLSSIPEHVVRISTLWLGGVGRDYIRLFLDLRMPLLERLTLWHHQCPGIPLAGLRDKGQAIMPFPRLSFLRTNCMQLPLCWITPAIRKLILGARCRAGDDFIFVYKCCHFDSLRGLFKALARSPDIAELELDYCLPEVVSADERMYIARLPPVHMQQLQAIHLGGAMEVVRTVMEYVSIPDTATVTLCVESGYESLCSLLPRTNPLAVVQQIRSLSIHVNNERLPSHPGSISAEIEPGDGRLSFHSGDFAFSHPDIFNFDLVLFLKGATAAFPPSNITRIEIKAMTYLHHDKEGWPWLFRHFPRVTDLVLDVYPDPRNALASLAPADVLVHLERLTVIMVAHNTSARENEALVSTLETRGARGLRLQSLYITREVERRGTGDHPALTVDQIARLQAVVDEFSIKLKNIQ